MQKKKINYFLINKCEYYIQLKKINRSNKEKINKNNREKIIISNIKTH